MHMEKNYDKMISTRWLITCIVLQVLSIILVSFSFVFAPLIKFKDQVGILTALFFISTAPDDNSDQKLYFYLYFSRLLNKDVEEDEHCRDAIYDYDTNSQVCDVLKRGCISNSILVVCLFMGLISCIMVIVLVCNMFKGRYFRYTNLVMIFSPVMFIVMTLVWWLVTDD